MPYKNPEDKRKNDRARYEMHRRRLFEYLGGKCCVSACNHNATELHHFDFHHTNGKSNHMHHIMKHSWKTIMKEVEDHDVKLICVMCHRDIHKHE